MAVAPNQAPRQVAEIDRPGICGNAQPLAGEDKAMASD